MTHQTTVTPIHANGVHIADAIRPAGACWIEVRAIVPGLSFTPSATARTMAQARAVAVDLQTTWSK